jgi:hypothetical protein
MKKLLLSLLIIGFLFPYNLFAAELPLTEKLLFNRQLKEFASKILLPEIRHSDPNQANIDIKNLREIITDKVLNSHEHLIELKNFILNNVLFSSAFKEFNKSICDKIKFDSLQFQNKDLNSLNDLEFSYNFNGDKKPQLTLSEKLLFKSSFNSSLHRPLFHIKKPYTFLSSKDLQQEFSLIVADYQKITDVDTLNKYGPSVVERSEKILLGTDDTLALDNVVYLIEMSGNCDIALKYGLSIPQDSKQKYFLEYINKIYNKAVIVNYKYCLWYYATRVYDSAKKYDELVEYSVNIKKDIFEKLNYDNKFSMTLLIGYCVTYYCEAKEKFYEIGKENCIQTINLVEFTNNPYYPTPEDKRILKLNYRLRLTAEFYAKYKYYNEAVYELDIIINSPPPATIPTISRNIVDIYNDIVKSAKKRKLELIPYMTIITLNFEGETLKKVYAYQNDNIYELVLNIKTGSKNIPQGLSIEFTFIDSFSHYNDEIKDPNKTFIINNGYKFLRNNSDGTDQKNFGFKSGNELKDTLILNNISETQVKIKFKYTSFGGDLFTIKAKTLSPYSAECSNQLQVWKKNTLKLYAMNNEINSKNLYPKVDFAIERLNECFIELIKEDNFPTEVKIPFHKKIFAEFPISVPPGEIGLTTFVEELGKISPEKIKFERQNKYINLIGGYEVHVIPTQNNPFPILRGFYLRYFGSQFGSNYTDKFFNSILMSYNELRDQEGKTLSHELGHAFGLEHPYNDIGTPGETKYEHQNNCLMYSGGSNPEGKFCENCIRLIKNNFINIGGTEFKVNKKKH